MRSKLHERHRSRPDAKNSPGDCHQQEPWSLHQGVHFRETMEASGYNHGAVVQVFARGAPVAPRTIEGQPERGREMSTSERVTAVGHFSDRTHAERAVAELCASGFQAEQIGFLTPGGDDKIEVPTLATGDRAGVGAGVGAMAGGALGGLLGAALATSIIPGVGPVIAGGLLVGAVEVALAGATGGGILGALVGMKIPEDEARHHHEAFHSGRTLVTVRAEERYDEALAILQRAAEWEEKPHRPPGQRLASLEDGTGASDGAGSAFVPRP